MYPPLKCMQILSLLWSVIYGRSGKVLVSFMKRLEDSNSYGYYPCCKKSKLHREVLLNVDFIIIQLGEANKSEDNCYGKDSLLLTIPKTKERLHLYHTTQGHTGNHQVGSGGRSEVSLLCSL